MLDGTILPGFIDMHIHLSREPWFGQRLLINGITSVRDTGNNFSGIIKLRQMRKNGKWIGPRIFTCGPLLDGSPAHWPHIAVGFEKIEDVEPMIKKLVDKGLDGFKTYVNAPPWLVESVVKYAHKHNIKVTCHLGNTTPSQALDYNIDCIEHSDCLRDDLLERTQGWEEFDNNSPKFNDLIKLFSKKRCFFCPTLATMEAIEHWWGAKFNEFPGYNEYPLYLKNWLKNWLAKMQKSDNWDSHQIADAEKGFRQQQILTKHCYDAGIPLLAGSDSPMVPVGSGFHYELELLAKSGIPNNDVLKMATLAGSQYLSADNKIGKLKPGMIADIVAVKGDPLEDITATRNVHALWIEGKAVDLNRLRLDIKESLANVSDNYSIEIPPFGISDQYKKV